MTRYNSFEDFGFILDSKDIYEMAAKNNAPAWVDRDSLRDCTEWLYENSLIEQQFSFTGAAHRIRDDGTADYWNQAEYYSDDCLYYFPIAVRPSIFKPLYTSMEDLIETTKRLNGHIFPDNFDYRNSFRKIIGTYYG